MNRDEGSYQLSHIYDRLFAATSGGEGKHPSIQVIKTIPKKARNVNNKYERLYLDEVFSRVK